MNNVANRKKNIYVELETLKKNDYVIFLINFDVDLNNVLKIRLKSGQSDKSG